MTKRTAAPSDTRRANRRPQRTATKRSEASTNVASLTSDRWRFIGRLLVAALFAIAAASIDSLHLDFTQHASLLRNCRFGFTPLSWRNLNRARNALKLLLIIFRRCFRVRAR